MAAASSAAATARAISQLVLLELQNGYGPAEAAADEAEAAAAVAEFSARMPVLPRSPALLVAGEERSWILAQRGETAAAMVRAIDARLPVCEEAAERGSGALEALRAESRAADERFAAEKERFVSAAIDGFLRLQEAYRECQRGRVSLKTGSRLIEPHVAEAQLLERELLERRHQLASGRSPEARLGSPRKSPTGSLADGEPVAVKRKRDDSEHPADTGSTRSPLAERASNEAELARGAESDAPSKRRRRWSRGSASDKMPRKVGDARGDGAGTAEDACVVQ